MLAVHDRNRGQDTESILCSQEGQKISCSFYTLERPLRHSDDTADIYDALLLFRLPNWNPQKSLITQMSQQLLFTHSLLHTLLLRKNYPQGSLSDFLRVS